jgi:hypothetical protein
MLTQTDQTMGAATEARVQDDHVHQVKYLVPNTIGLAASRGENEPYVNVIMGRTVVLPAREACEAARCAG